MALRVKFTVICNNGDGRRELSLPGKYVVCTRCGGDGEYCNPAIDGHGLTQEDFDADPDFAEGYISGRYNIPCRECKGERVVPELLFDRLPKALLARVKLDLEACALDREEERLNAMGIEF